MSKALVATAIGMSGVAKMAPETGGIFKAVFTADTAADKIIKVPQGDYGVFVSLAGAADLDISVSRDSHAAVDDGTAEFTTPAAYDAVAAGDYFYGDCQSITAIKISHVKNGAVADNATTVAKLGGRCQVRAVATEANPAQLATFGVYAGTFAANPNYAPAP